MLPLLGNLFDLCSWDYAHDAWARGKTGHYERPNTQNPFTTPSYTACLYDMTGLHTLIPYLMCFFLNVFFCQKCLCLQKQIRQKMFEINHPLYMHCMIHMHIDFNQGTPMQSFLQEIYDM